MPLRLPFKNEFDLPESISFEITKEISVHTEFEISPWNGTSDEISAKFFLIIRGTPHAQGGYTRNDENGIAVLVNEDGGDIKTQRLLSKEVTFTWYSPSEREEAVRQINKWMIECNNEIYDKFMKTKPILTFKT